MNRVTMIQTSTNWNPLLNRCFVIFIAIHAIEQHAISCTAVPTYPDNRRLELYNETVSRPYPGAPTSLTAPIETLHSSNDQFFPNTAETAKQDFHFIPPPPPPPLSPLASVLNPPSRDGYPESIGTTGCRLQLECSSRKDSSAHIAMQDATHSLSESRIRVPVRSARGPSGPIGPMGLKGDRGQRGLRGPPGDCKHTNNLTLNSQQLHEVTEQVRLLQIHVAFFAGLEYNIVKKPIETVPRVIMNRVVTNVGRAYDAVSGEFTAPINGVYVLVVAVSAQGKSRAAVRLMHNDQQIFDIWAESSPWSTTTNQAILHMYKGDRAWLSIREGAYYLHGYMYSTFSGYLLFQLPDELARHIPVHSTFP